MTPKTGAIRLATLRLFLPDGGCALSGLRSVRPAFNLFTMLTETAGVGGLKTPRWRCRLPGLQRCAIW